MSVSSSSNLNASLPFSPPSSPINMYTFLHNCFNSKVGTFSVTAFAITSILILFPLCSLVLYLGLQRWRQQRSSMTISHSDLFTYHMAFSDLISVFGSTLTTCGVHTAVPQMMTVGIHLCTINLFGQTLFHILTCVERYLAVVHPITYLSLRKAKGIRIRNITIGCVWLTCFASPGLMYVEDVVSIDIVSYCITVSGLIVISFCSLAVLCVLIRPGPGEGGRNRQKVDQTKLRAFYTIMAILGVLLFRVGGNILATYVHSSTQLGDGGRCSVWMSVFWFSLPSTLVLPLLFLQRAGKLLCCKNNNESGQVPN